jgi:iron complex outermembrane receptor protein
MLARSVADICASPVYVYGGSNRVRQINPAGAGNAVKSFARFRSCCRGLVLLTLLWTQSAWGANGQIDFDIPRTSAIGALTRFAQQADVQLIYPYDDVKNVEVSGLSGVYSVERGIERLLQGTCLEAVFGTNRVPPDPPRGAKNYQELAIVKKQNCSNDKSFIASLAAMILSILSHAQAHAQGLSEDKTSIEEVMVTARRTQESSQSVPVSVTAFSAKALREAQISTPEDLQINTPGVYLSGSGARQNVIYQVRGQSKSVSGPSSPAVVSYFAEVPDPTFGSFVPGYDLASVQVLKGPQGTLFGRNTTGGAVLYTPTEPGYEVGGYVSSNFGNYNKREFQGALNIPLITDKAALRIAADVNRSDGWVKNLGVGGDLEMADTKSFRASLLLQPTDSIRNLTIVDYFDSENDGYSTLLGNVRPQFNLLDILGLRASVEQQLAQQQARSAYVEDTSVAPLDKLKRVGVTNRTELSLGALELVNIFGYRNVDLAYLLNVDGLPSLSGDGTVYPVGLPINYIKGALNQETQQYTDEIQLRGKALGDRLDFLVGAFWLKSEPDGSQGSTVSFGEPAGIPVANAGYNFITEESRALFTNLKYDLGGWVEGLGFEVGARYTEDELRSCTGNGITPSSSDVKDDGCRPGNPNILNASTTGSDSNKVTWSVGLNWQVNPDLFTYAVVRQGYRAGGANGPSLGGRLAAYQKFEPETVNDVEVGVRSDWSLGDVNFRANVSAFLGRYEDVQVALTGVTSSLAGCDASSTNNPLPISVDGDCNVNNDPSGGTLMVNAGKSQVSGVDLDFTIAPTDRLSVRLSANFLDLETKRFGGGPAVAPFFPGNEIPFNYTSKKTFAGDIRYAQPLDGGFARELVANLDYYWTDDIFYIDEQGSVPSYDLVNLRVDLNEIAGTGLDISAYARNLFDKEYFSSGAAAGAFIGISTYVLGPPRLYGVELRYSF